MQKYCGVITCAHFAVKFCSDCCLSLCNTCSSDQRFHGRCCDGDKMLSPHVFIDAEHSSHSSNNRDNNSSGDSHSVSSSRINNSRGCSRGDRGDNNNDESVDNSFPSISFSILHTVSHPQHSLCIESLKYFLQSASFVVLTVNEEEEEGEKGMQNEFDIKSTAKNADNNRERLEKGGVVCIKPRDALLVFARAEKTISNFFLHTSAQQKNLYQSSHLIDGGNRRWELGFHHAGPREYFVCFATKRAQLQRESWWPKDEFMNDFFAIANLYKDICLNILTFILPTQAASIRKEQNEDKDSSIMEAFFYPNDRGGTATTSSSTATTSSSTATSSTATTSKKALSKHISLLSLLPNCPPHIDPGLLSIEVASETPGLECFDLRTDRWVAVDSLCRSGKDVIVMVGGTLEDRSKGLYKATRHRVVSKPQPRISYLYELLVS